jgi:thiol:disulfide interchange protein DsbC
MEETVTRRRFMAAAACALAVPGTAFAQGGVAWSSLPFQWAIAHKYGTGRRRIAVFSDPRCPYCKRFERDLAQLGDITMHVFPYAVLGPDSIRLSKAVWCAPDRAKAWDDLMQRRIEPRPATCADPIDQLMAYGRSIGARSTPTWYLENGERHIGAQPIAHVAKLLDRASPARP